MAAAATGRSGRSGRLARVPDAPAGPDLTMVRGGRGRPRSAEWGSRREGRARDEGGEAGSEARGRPARVGPGAPGAAPSPARPEPDGAGAGAVRGVRAGEGPVAPADEGGRASAALTCATRAIARPAADAPRLRRRPARQFRPGPSGPRPGKASSGVRAAPRPAPSPPLDAARSSPQRPRPTGDRRDPRAPSRCPAARPHAGQAHSRPAAPRRAPPPGFAACRKAAPRAVATLPCAAAAARARARARAMASWRDRRGALLPLLCRAFTGRGRQLAPERDAECRDAAPSRVSGVPGEVGPRGVAAGGAPGQAAPLGRPWALHTCVPPAPAAELPGAARAAWGTGGWRVRGPGAGAPGPPGDGALNSSPCTPPRPPHLVQLGAQPPPRALVTELSLIQQPASKFEDTYFLYLKSS